MLRRLAIRVPTFALLVVVAVGGIFAQTAGAATTHATEPITRGNIAHVLTKQEMHELAGSHFTTPRVVPGPAGEISYAFGPQAALSVQPGSAGYREFVNGYKPFGQPVHLGQLTGYVQWTGEYNLGVYVDGELIAFQGHSRFAVIDVAGRVLFHLHLLPK